MQTASFGIKFHRPRPLPVLGGCHVERPVTVGRLEGGTVNDDIRILSDAFCIHAADRIARDETSQIYHVRPLGLRHYTVQLTPINLMASIWHSSSRTFSSRYLSVAKRFAFQLET